MIKAIFKKKYFWNIVCLLCGLFIIGLFVFVGLVDSEATTADTLSGVIFGLIIFVCSIVFLLFNFKAYLYIENKHIKGRYNWFRKIDCDISDVEFALFNMSTLTIQLKNVKRHVIGGLENPLVLCSVIRRNISFDTVAQPAILIEKLNNLKSTQKKEFILVCVGLILMFINIFITAFLTGERELSEFSKIDWLIMAIMSTIELITIAVTFYFASKTGKKNTPIEQIKYAIQRTIIETNPLLPGNVIRVYTDDNYSGRITLFRYSNENSVYYSVQEFNSDYILESVFTSEIYEDMEHIPNGFEFLIDITDKVLH